MNIITFPIHFFHLILISYRFLNAAPIIEQGSQSTNNSSTSIQPRLPALPQQNILPSVLEEPFVLPKFVPPKDFNLTEIAKDLRAFGIHSLEDDKHLEGLPLDRQGKVNPEFHKEIFLGNHELFEAQIQTDENLRNEKLKEIFSLADVDRSGKLSKDELLDYVLRNIQKHLQEAKQKNTQLFILIDTDKDGKISWHEYFLLYVSFHGMNISNTSVSEDFETLEDPLDANLQREMMKIRYRWMEADTSIDNYLDIDEFLAFRHPEISGHGYKNVVEDIIVQMDRNGDEKLEENEFAFLPSVGADDDENKDWAEIDKRWLDEQKQEFREMDTDHNGILTMEELSRAYDPMNRVHIGNQIRKLFVKVDDDPKDDSLSLNEILKHADIFTDMHILDPDKALHDEM